MCVCVCVCIYICMYIFATNGPWGYYAKWSKSDRGRQIPYELLCGILKTNKQQTNKIQSKKTGNWLVVARGGGVGGAVGEMGELFFVCLF